MTAAAVIAGAAVALVALVVGFGLLCYRAGLVAGTNEEAARHLTSSLDAERESRDATRRANDEFSREMAKIDGASRPGDLDSLLMRIESPGDGSPGGGSPANAGPSIDAPPPALS